MEKVINRFEVFVSRPAAAEHIDWLHDEVELRYQYLDANRRPERLRMNSTLFSLLLDLADGYQLIGESSQDAFANLSVFTQRLAEETQDEIFAWAFGVNGLVMQPPEPLMEIFNGLRIQLDGRLLAYSPFSTRCCASCPMARPTCHLAPTASIRLPRRFMLSR